ncbi:sodium:proton antiporter [Nocardioides sp. CFH 31398]|uniref:cation:proton antiporter n=1 Tax=Nocardioides sp. CFH 31398 TaxID=2919579 RepID=UPI001F056AE1|nr:sodium:proton antiporter [Nocardioides sp. CFH 31398]MCH1866387.1 sodium:proton antiporter [Nocardioides sp. CFH 31398]
MSHQLLLVAGAALAIMIAASVFSRRTGVAAPLLLVGLGIAVSYVPASPVIRPDPELVLTGVLPLLLYSSAVNLPVIDVRRNLGLITWLSVVMVVVQAVVIGAAVHLVFPDVSLALGIALGAVVSPTDAVAATAVGRRLGLPPRVMTVLEGESLVNDASALVVLRTAVAVLALTGEFSLGATAVEFGWAVLGAGLIGGVVGVLTVRLRQRLDDPVLNTTISFAVPFLAFLPAESLEASGVLAVVVAGLVTGAQGSHRFSAEDRQTQGTTWTTVSFVLESAVFLAMGYQLPQLVDDVRGETTVGAMTGLVVLVLGLLVVLRFAGLAWPVLQGRRGGRREERRRLRDRFDAFEEHLDALSPETERQEKRVSWARHRLARSRADVAFEEREPLTGRGLLVIAWAGMRGVVTVAAVQTIPDDVPQRATIVLAAFLVALVTLVAFGLTLPAVIRRTGLEAVSAEDQRDAVHALLRQVGTTALETVGPPESLEVDGDRIDPQVAATMKERILPRLVAGVRERREAPAGVIEQSLSVQRIYLDAMRDALAAERRIGAYPSATYRRVESMLDTMEQRLQPGL